MSAVAVAISVVRVDSVGTPFSAALEVGMLNVDTSIDTVDEDALASGGIVGVVSGARLAAGGTGKTPRRNVGLSDELRGAVDAFGLDVFDL